MTKFCPCCGQPYIGASYSPIVNYPGFPTGYERYGGFKPQHIHDQDDQGHNLGRDLMTDCTCIDCQAGKVPGAPWGNEDKTSEEYKRRWRDTSYYQEEEE